MKRYEGMFLFDNSAALEWPAVEQEVRRLYDRIGADMQACVKFDERKLAFEINGRKRGTYVLTYFDAAPERIADLERDARLSEMILRLLVLRADKITPERIAELQAWQADTPLVPSPGDGRRHGDDYRYKRDYGPPKREDARTARTPDAESASSVGSSTRVTPASVATRGAADAPIEEDPDNTGRTTE